MYKEVDLQEGPVNFPTKMANAIYEAWCQFAPSKKIPARNDIDPLLIPKKYLSSIWLYEYVPERDSYRQILAGQDILDAWQDTPKSPFIEEFMDANAILNVKNRWDFLRKTPAVSSYSITTNDEFQYTERVGLPMCDKHGDINYVFGCSIYERLRGVDVATPPSDMEGVSLFKIE